MNEAFEKQPSNIEKAIKLALEAHWGQVDKQSQPYILHPLRVMASVDNENEKIAAILHDVLEDSGFTLDDLNDSGLPTEAISAVFALTRRKNEDYAFYVMRCKENEIARKVKMVDLQDNSRIDRSLSWNLVKYHQAWKFLAGQITKEEYTNG